MYINQQIIRKLSGIGVVTLLIFLCSCIKDDPNFPDEVINYIEVNDAIPAFTVSDGQGNSFSSSSFIGKRSLLVLFHTSCKDCQRELPKANAVWEALQDDPNYLVLTIGREEKAESISRFWESAGLGLPYYLDPDRSVFSLFANSTIPRFYIIDQQGVVTWMGIETIALSAEELLEKVKGL